MCSRSYARHLEKALDCIVIEQELLGVDRAYVPYIIAETPALVLTNFRVLMAQRAIPTTHS